MKRNLILGTFCVLALLLSTILVPCESLATTISGTSTSITINDPPYGISSVKIALPGGDVIAADEFTVFAKDSFPDGDYQYQLIGKLEPSNVQKKSPADGLANGRGNVTPRTPIGVVESGDFRIVNGVVYDTRTLVENQ